MAPHQTGQTHRTGNLQESSRSSSRSRTHERSIEQYWRLHLGLLPLPAQASIDICGTQEDLRQQATTPSRGRAKLARAASWVLPGWQPTPQLAGTLDIAALLAILCARGSVTTAACPALHCTPPQSAAFCVSVTLLDAATSTTSFVMRLLSKGVTARLSAEPPSAKGTALEVKLMGLQYLGRHENAQADVYYLTTCQQLERPRRHGATWQLGTRLMVADGQLHAAHWPRSNLEHLLVTDALLNQCRERPNW